MAWIIMSVALSRILDLTFLFFISLPLAMAISINSCYYIYDEQTMIRMSMGRYSIYDRALAKDRIDYACISYGYNLKIRACRGYESESWRVDF